MKIRKATIQDIDSIMEVEATSFIKSIQEEKEVFLERIKRCPELFLIFEDDKSTITGYLSAEFMEKIPTTAQELQLGHLPKIPDLSKKEQLSSIYISSFALRPTFRGSGLGKLMWNEAMDYFKNQFPGVTFILLVNEVWQGAFHIYSSAGFEEIQRFENFFPTEGKTFTTGILMVKR